MGIELDASGPIPTRVEARDVPHDAVGGTVDSCNASLPYNRGLSVLVDIGSIEIGAVH